VAEKRSKPGESQESSVELEAWYREVAEGSRSTGRPYGLLPRVSAKSPDKASVEFVLDIAEQLYPGIVHLEELDRQEQKFWLPFSTTALGGFEGSSVLLDRITTIMQGSVEAEVSRSIALAEQASREQAELHLQELHQRKARLLQELREREDRHKLLVREREDRHDLWMKERLGRFQTLGTEAEIPPPPPSPVYTTLVGNQWRWAVHVLRYAFQQRRLRNRDPHRG